DVIKDFENDNIGSIGFDAFSKVFGQCSVYPLALEDENQNPISPLIQENGKPVNPQTDLCKDKGNYRPNIKAFISERYPLAYPLTVIYPRDNRLEPKGKKFAEILRTKEIQRLLQQTGLIPLQPLD
ncbi:MAG: phosphate ABC transporter substrate-binding protein, partial [Moorea sp. SIO2B7]|nr:phosphate ABC transporter substrate-binding protein [Moorena sp. SIO2B7]